jgi:hypothetical protein
MCRHAHIRRVPCQPTNHIPELPKPYQNICWTIDPAARSICALSTWMANYFLTRRAGRVHLILYLFFSVRRAAAIFSFFSFITYVSDQTYCVHVCWYVLRNFLNLNH